MMRYGGDRLLACVQKPESHAGLRRQSRQNHRTGISRRGYHAKAKALYDSLRQRQKDYPQRLADGETLEALAEETWQLLCDNA